MQKYAIIVAGGKGARMCTDLPKQFLQVYGVPIIVRTINAFLNAVIDIKVVLALPKSHVSLWKGLESKYFGTNAPITTCVGGATRFESVRNALELIINDSLVAVHDAVRPFVTKDIIISAFEAAFKHGAAATCVASKDSVMVISGDLGLSVDRSAYRLVQTPQSFKSKILKAAYQEAKDHHHHHQFTDDASVVENAGYPIFLIEGSYRNIKITTSEDLLISEAFLKP